jgi:cytochrome c oxidase subunit IV
MHDEAAHEAVDAGHGTAQYYWVWAILLVLTVVEIALAYKHVFGPTMMLTVLLALSIVKAAMIIAYFMHMKFETSRMQWYLMASLVVVLCLMSIFFPDAMRITRIGVQ